MKQLAAAAVLSLALAGAGAAEETETPQPEDGLSMIQEGARLLLRGLQDEMDPALDELRGWAEEIEPALRDFVLGIGPALREFSDRVDDFSNYEAPEMLPNGDIIIRRRPDAPPVAPPSEDIEI